VAPHHHLSEMIGPVTPEGEVNEKHEHEHDELKAIPDLTDLAKCRHVHILEEEDASENRND
jgi:hypothetical protein